MSAHHPHKKSLLIYQKYALLVLLAVYFGVVCLGIYSGFVNGTCKLFFLIEYFTVVKHANAIVFWVHLGMGFVILMMLANAIPRVYMQIKRLKAKP